MPLSFAMSPAQAERLLREAGWTVAPLRTATGIFPGKPGDTIHEVEHTSVHATRSGWHLNASFEWSVAKRFDRTSPPLPSETAVLALVGEMKARLGEPTRSQPFGPDRPLATWQAPASIEVRVQGRPGTWALTETWIAAPPAPGVSSVPPPQQPAPPHPCPWDAPTAGSPCQPPRPPITACTYTKGPQPTLVCTCTPERVWSCMSLPRP